MLMTQYMFAPMRDHVAYMDSCLIQGPKFAFNNPIPQKLRRVDDMSSAEGECRFPMQPRGGKDAG